MNIQYTGEHLLAGEIGKFLVLLAFFTALFSAIYYFLSENETKSYSGKLKKVARKVFWIHCFTILGVAVVLYLLIFNHYYEYSYVWKYSSNDLPVKYVISCFWAGQEGSFIIWALWQAILGVILIFFSRKWEAPVMAVVSISQVFLSAALLGMHVGGFTLGSSPFVLLRNGITNAGDVFFRDTNYISQLIDGQGLNPLLENPWMVVHPPLLFLGYAAALIPFAFAYASLRRSDYFVWVKPALSWNLFALFTLGGGIMLGGSWAYKSLTFGGFWSWDPVENASLVPWLILLLTLHLYLIAKKQQQSLFFAYIFSFAGYIAVLYASYLTRSGVLAETSAHSFGNEGLPLHLIIFLLFFVTLAIFILAVKAKKIPKCENEKLLSREFIMFLASAIVFLASFQIIVATSIPLINKFFDTSAAPPADRVTFYNTWQMPFTILMVICIGLSQYLLYGENSMKRILKKTGIYAGTGLAITLIISIITSISVFSYQILLFALFFALSASVDYLARYICRRKNFASVFTHTGFLIFLTGVVLAFSQSKIISQNTSGIAMGDNSLNNENQVLIQNHPMPMGKYFVVYKDSEIKGKHVFYNLDFYASRPDSLSKPLFRLSPSININPRMGNVHEPSTKHFIGKDIYVYITFADVQSVLGGSRYSLLHQQEMKKGDTLRANGNKIVLDNLKVESYSDKKFNARITAYYTFINAKGKKQKQDVSYIVDGDSVAFSDRFCREDGLKIRFEKVSDIPQHIVLGIYEKNPEYIVVKAIIFPNILVVWIGAFITFAGIAYALLRRIWKKGK